MTEKTFFQHDDHSFGAFLQGEANTLFRSIVDVAPDAIAIADTAGKILHRNKAFSGSFGEGERRLFSGTVIAEGKWFLPPDGVLCEAVCRDGFWEGEVEKKGQNGECGLYEVTARLFRNSGGEAVGIVARFSEITEAKQKYRLLEDRERKLRTMLDQIPDLIYRVSVSGKICFVSAAVTRLTGYTSEEVLGKNVMELFDINPNYRINLFAALEKEVNVCNQHLLIKRKDGSVFMGSANTHFFRDENGKIAGIEGVVRDITDVQAASDDLKEQERLLRAILEASPTPVVVYDASLTPLYLSPVFTKLFGWTLEELRGKTIPYIPDDQHRRTDDILQQILRTGTPKGFDTKRLTRDGRILDVFFSGAPMWNETRKDVEGLVVHLVDLTEQKTFEAQFERAERMESIATLAGGIAHDFNNLLSGVYGYVDLARTITGDTDCRDLLDRAYQTLDRATSLTAQLLTFSRGGQPVRKVQPIAKIIHDVTQFALSGSAVAADIILPRELWMCNFDRNQISQVIENLVINAQQAMNSFGRITVRAVNAILREAEYIGLAPGEYVRIEVHDTGKGIPQEHLERIFDPFFTTKDTGSGLGLATSYSIVKKHDGLLVADSHPGKGTTFVVFLPAARRVEMSEEIHHSQEYSGYGKILVMDDQEMMQTMLGRMLERLGFTVETASKGEEALKFMSLSMRQTEGYRAVFLDLTVRGGMGGKETVARIRQFDGEIPVFVVSGYSDDDVMVKPEFYGFTASLKKPFGIDQLSDMLHHHL